MDQSQMNRERLGRIIAELNAVEAFTDVIYSLALDLDTIPEFRLTVGFPAARKAASYIIQGLRTAYGAIYRLNNGEMSAVWTLAVAGQMLEQSLKLINDYLVVMQSKIPSDYQTKFRGQLTGLDKVEPGFRQIAKQIEELVGPAIWSAAKEPVVAILRPVQE